jgi:O-6-methylguanine DNA methyltransferase
MQQPMNTRILCYSLPIQTADGKFVAGYSEKGMASLSFPGTTGAPPQNAGALPRKIQAWHRTATRALQQSLAGKNPGKLPPLDLSAGTAFQQAAWNALHKIARGQTRSYGEIAQTMRRPKAVRAIGGACGANPIPVFIPCHRVLAADKKLGGFSGGLDWKRTLLEREGVRVS